QAFAQAAGDEPRIPANIDRNAGAAGARSSQSAFRSPVAISLSRRGGARQHASSQRTIDRASGWFQRQAVSASWLLSPLEFSRARVSARQGRAAVDARSLRPLAAAVF